MQDSYKNLLSKIEALRKAMSNGGLGGAGSVRNGGAVLPNKIAKPKKSNNSLSSKIKIPSVGQKSIKDPIKSAQQIHNKDIKDIKMKEAISQVGEMIKSLPNGQWELVTQPTPTIAQNVEQNSNVSTELNHDIVGSLQKINEKIDQIEEKLSKKSRCWEGCEPVPGKKAYEKGSCRPMKKKECECEDENNKCACD